MERPQKPWSAFYQDRILVWFGNLTQQDHKQPRGTVKTASKNHINITASGHLHQERGKALRIMEDATHPAHGLFSLWPLRDRFPPQALRVMNSRHLTLHAVIYYFIGFLIHCSCYLLHNL